MLQVSVFRGAGSAAPCVGKKERNIPAGVIQRSRPSRPPGMSLTAPRESHLAAHLSFSVRFRSSSVHFRSVQFSAPNVHSAGLVPRRCRSLGSSVGGRPCSQPAMTPPALPAPIAVAQVSRIVMQNRNMHAPLHSIAALH